MKTRSLKLTPSSKVQTYVCTDFQFLDFGVGAARKSIALMNGARDDRVPHTVTARFTFRHPHLNSAITTEGRAIVDGSRGNKLRLMMTESGGHAS